MEDSETDAEGWIVINSLRGSQGGGTRMRKGLNKHMVSLAKTMEIKLSLAQRLAGQIRDRLDPKDPRKTGVLKGGSQQLYHY